MSKESCVAKIDFIKSISDAIKKVQRNIDEIKYEVYVDSNNDDIVCEEYLVIVYRGGAITVRNCYGNSCSAIFEEISRYLNNGYYDEVDYYLKNVFQNNNLKLL